MANRAICDIGAYFKQDAFSDVTVKWGAEGEHSMRCHKIVLSSRSEYFSNMLKHGSFKESEQGVVQLKEDDDEAVEAMLRYIYTFNYIISEEARTSFSFHRKVATVANKYGIKDLEKTSLDNFKDLAASATTMPQILMAFMNFEVLHRSNFVNDSFKAWEARFIKKHASKLLQDVTVRDLVESDVKLAMRFLDSVVFPQKPVK